MSEPTTNSGKVLARLLESLSDSLMDVEGLDERLDTEATRELIVTIENEAVANGYDPFDTTLVNGVLAVGAGRAVQDEGLPTESPDGPLRTLLDAIETMDQKITPYGEREDGTTLHYILADSTWHRVLAAARNPHWGRAVQDGLDPERLARAMSVSDSVAWPKRWEPEDFDWIARQIAAEYARLAAPPLHDPQEPER